MFYCIFSLATTLGSDIILTSFNSEIGSTYSWIETNDPVMGGESTGNFSISNNTGIFLGNCVNVPSLNAPGFCKINTQKKLKSTFPDLSDNNEGGLKIKFKTEHYNYDGYRIAFSAKNIPRTSIFGGGSFKAGFSKYLNKTNDWQIVSIPFNDFSYDWSAFTGECNTTDPNGQVHHCCSKDDNYKYCTNKTYLSNINELELWAEGSVGLFSLYVETISSYK